MRIRDVIEDESFIACKEEQGSKLAEFDTILTAARLYLESEPILTQCAGQKPTITFTLKDKSGNPILPSQMARLRVQVAGPTTDYASVFQEDLSKAQGTQDGTYFWTFVNPIPAIATFLML